MKRFFSFILLFTGLVCYGYAQQMLTLDSCRALALANNKELRIIPGASHTDLYDQMSLIPFEKLNTFFQENLK